MLHFPGSASSFSMSWPAVRNQEVFIGDLPYLNKYLDMTKPPHGSG
jgi:hypothetical protein